MLENRIRLLPLNSIIFPESRWRKSIDISHLYPLALNITKLGLLQNIGVDAANNNLAFGGRRYHAFLLISAVLSGTNSSLTTKLSKEEYSTLQASAQANPLYEKWTKIPARFGYGLSQLSSQAIEYAENIRDDLSWQENSTAALALHTAAITEAHVRKEQWSYKQTAALIGISSQYLSELIKPHRQVIELPEKLIAKAEEIIKNAPSANRAAIAIQDMSSRYGYVPEQKGPTLALGTQPQVDTLALGTQPQVDTLAESDIPIGILHPKSTLADSLLCTDFHGWARSYNGYSHEFNFIHCDFPYGINYNQGSGQNSSLATTQVGNYNDNPDTYWNLLETLLSIRDHISQSCHIMFWLSMQNYDETKETIWSKWPDAHISKLPLIWHCSDNSGILSDPRREPRRTYEVAIKITLGDRPLVKGRAASFAYPRNQDIKIHRSQKHIPVLEHFFGMFVDSSTHMLDPTAGSATSLLAAHKLGAASILGLELDQETYELAQTHLQQQT